MPQGIRSNTSSGGSSSRRSSGSSPSRQSSQRFKGASSQSASSRSSSRNALSGKASQRFSQVPRPSTQGPQKSDTPFNRPSTGDSQRAQASSLKPHTLATPVTHIVSSGKKLDLQRSPELIENSTNQKVPHGINIKGDNNQLSLPHATPEAPFLSIIEGNNNQVSTKMDSGQEVSLSGGNNNQVSFSKGAEPNDVYVAPNPETGKTGSGNVFDAAENTGFNQVHLNGFGDRQNYDIRFVNDKFDITNKATGENNSFKGFQEYHFGESPWVLHHGSAVGSGWFHKDTGQFVPNQFQ